jgi:hypothetical protein
MAWPPQAGVADWLSGLVSQFYLPMLGRRALLQHLNAALPGLRLHVTRNFNGSPRQMSLQKHQMR